MGRSAEPRRPFSAPSKPWPKADAEAASGFSTLAHAVEEGARLLAAAGPAEHQVAHHRHDSA